MNRSRTTIAFAASVAAAIAVFGGVRIPAFGATDPGVVNPYEKTIGPPLADPGVPARPAVPAVRERIQTGNPLWGVPLRSLSATRDRPLFSPSRRPPPLPVIATPYVAPVRPPPPKPPEPDHPLLSLVGTIAGETEGFGIFVDQSTREVIRLRTGQEHSGWLLRSVQGRNAVFERGSLTATLALPAPGAEQSAQAAQPSSAGPATGDLWMDGDGRMISPPKRTAQPVVAAAPPASAPTPISTPTQVGVDAWMGPQK